MLSRKEDLKGAQQAYANAALEEVLALDDLDPDKDRTYGVTVVSAASLFHLAGHNAAAQALAHRHLATRELPDFAREDLQELLQVMWDETARDRAGIALGQEQIHVSIRGERIFRGAAPAGLVDSTVKRLEALLYRVAEFELNLPYRTRGSAPKRITDEYKPWLLQSSPGSYQFAVTLTEPAQLQLLDRGGPTPSEVVERSLQIVAACVRSPSSALVDMVRDESYRRIFLKLARDLSPNGASYDVLKLQRQDSESVVNLSAATRYSLTSAIWNMQTASAVEIGEVREYRGILRGVDLNRDWLRIDAASGTVTFQDVGETIDDLIGPMVNRRVIVSAAEDDVGKLHFRDIEPDE